jgi:hypothetical protein
MTDLEYAVTNLVKAKFFEADMKWESTFTVDTFVRMLCILYCWDRVNERNAVRQNCIKPVL